MFSILCLFIYVTLSFRVILNYTYPNDKGVNTLAYLSDYDTDLKRPYQVGFIYTCELAKEATSDPKPPRPGFRSDPRLPYKDQAVDSDYTNTPYSRGHLGTAKYFSFNNDSYFDSFYLTNVAPQFQLFNQKWYTFDENVVLQWAATNSNCKDDIAIDVTVIGINGTIGKDDVAVPEYYVDGVCEPNTGQSICFYGANVLEAVNNTWVYYTSLSDCQDKFDFKFFTLDIYQKYKNCWKKMDDYDESFWGIDDLSSDLDFIQRSP